MPDEPIGSVRVDVVADYSKLSQGFQAAQGQAAQAGASIASSFNSAVSPTNNLAAATERLKNAEAALASEGAKQLAQVKAAAPGYQAAQRALLELNAELAAARANHAALAAARTGSAAAAETHAKATAHEVTQLQAMSGFIRTIDGAGGIRAVENFLAKTVGLGPAIQRIFPIIGAIAFSEILVKLTQEMIEFFRAAQDAPEQIKGAFGELANSSQLANDELRVTNDRLDEQIAKLQGKPVNRLAEALDEAKVEADKLQETLLRTLGTFYKLVQENKVGLMRQILLGEKGTLDLEQHLGGRTGFGGEHGKEAAITDTYRAALDTVKPEETQKRAAIQLAELTALQQNNRRELEYTNKALETDTALLAKWNQTHGEAGRNAQAEIEILKARRSAILRDIDITNLRFENAKKTEKVGDLKGQKEASDAAKQAAQEQYRIWQDELATMKAHDAVTLSEERAFWAEKLATAQAGGAAYAEIVRSIDNKVGQLHQEAIRRSIAEGNKSEAETLHEIQQQMKQAEEDAAEAGGHPAATKLNLLKDLTSSDTGLSAANYQKLFDQIPEAQRAADKEATADLKKMLAEQDLAWEESGIRTAKEVRARAEITRAALEDLRPFFVGIDSLIDAQTAKIASANKRIEAEKLRVAELVARNQEAGGEAEIQQRRIALESAYGLQSVHTYQQQIAYQQQLAALEAESLQLKLAKADADYRAAVASRDEVRIQQALNEQAAAGAAIDLQRQQSEAELAKLKKEQSIGGQISVGLNQDAESAVSRISSGIATLTTQTRGWGQEFKAVLRDIERSIVQTLAHAALKAGLNKLLEFGQSKFGGGGGGGVLGTTVGAAGGAAATISKTVSGAANTAAQSANTAALTADTTALVANSAASTALAATMATEIAAQTVTDSLMAGMLFALSANTAALIATTVALYVNAATNIFGFAAGGDPPVGIPSLVGEQGPELFIPKSAGTIIPADKTRAMLAEMQKGFAGFRVPAGALAVPNVPSSAFLSTDTANGISGAAGGAVTNQNTGRTGDTHYNIYGANNPREVMRQIADFEKRQTGRYSPANS